MTDKEKECLLEDIIAAIKTIKGQYEVEVIKDYEIPPRINTKTCEYTGFGVKLQLNTRYDYNEEILDQWKQILKADDWYISVNRNQLHITFTVRYKDKSV